MAKTAMKALALANFCIAALVLIPFSDRPVLWAVGWLALVASAAALHKTDLAFRRRMAVLLGCLVVLAFTPLSTNADPANFLALGVPFLAVVALPWLIFRGEPGLLTFPLLPERWVARDLGYVLLSVPLAYGILWLYLRVLNPEAPFNWPMPPGPQGEPLLRMFVGINLVGLWEVLFFAGTVFVLLRSMFPFWAANLGQAAVHVALLFDMAFSGWGPLFVLVLALAQGWVFERTKALIYVMALHAVVDVLLFQRILDAYYPDHQAWWHP